MSSLRAAVVVCALVVPACAGIPLPRSVEQADEAAVSPAVLEAKIHAPPAWAEAERRRLEAHEALEEGPLARAQILGEEAVALYSKARSLARITRATLRAESALARAEASEKELALLDAELLRATADVQALDVKVRVARDAQPVIASGAATPEREAARREVARAMVVEARVLCLAARVAVAALPTATAAPKDPGDPLSTKELLASVDEASEALEEVAAALAKQDKATPIDLATRTRAACLSALTRARRAKTAGRPKGASDALLSALAAMRAGLEPTRDERGVAVVLRRVFEGEGIAQLARTRLEELDRVAGAHPDFAVAVVVHTDRPVPEADRNKWEARASKVAAALTNVPLARSVVVFAGDAVPVVPGSSPDRGKNARVEVIFLAPEAL